MITGTLRHTLVNVPAHADGLSWLVTEKKKTKTTTHCP
jgi:hypothetical protein